MREEFMKRIDARDSKIEYDPASYPFGAEDLLLQQELKQLEGNSKKEEPVK